LQRKGEVYIWNFGKVKADKSLSEALEKVGGPLEGGGGHHPHYQQASDYAFATTLAIRGMNK
jgi:hypothetical protein